jgi:glutathione S-transferase
MSEAQMLKLYHHPVSGHAHRALLFLSLIGVPYELIHVDLSTSAHKQPDFLAINSFGQVPVLVDDDDTVVPDSNAILVYLARKHGRTDWLPDDTVGAARVQRWLSVAAGEIAAGPGTARKIILFNLKLDLADAIKRAHAVIELIEAALQQSRWIAADHATIADIALYSYIARAPDGNVDLAPYPAIRAWLAAIEDLPGFTPMAVNRVGLSS